MGNIYIMDSEMHEKLSKLRIKTHNVILDDSDCFDTVIIRKIKNTPRVIVRSTHDVKITVIDDGTDNINVIFK